MNIQPYITQSDSERLIFSFESVSQRQTIKKIVLFTPIDNTSEIFNLALCDLDENDELRDDTTSNNDDVERIMATVIAIVQEFFATYPTKKVFFEGNTAPKTRLYQIAINRVIHELSEKFVIEGVHQNKIEKFQKNVNYSAFFVSSKN